MNRTSIEYCDFSWNPVSGCLGPGGTPDKPNRCPYCYAHRKANGLLKKLYLSNPNVAPGCDPDDPFSPRFWPKRLGDPLKRRKAAKIFVVDMGDLFHPVVPDAWLYDVLAIAEGAPQHTFQYLTKTPEGYLANSLWQRNQWLGITVTNKKDWDERWPILAEVDCAVKFVSFEPLLGPIALKKTWGRRLDWIIIGAQTKPDRQPDIAWVNDLRDQNMILGLPVFHKNNLDCEAMGIQRRQEWPKEKR